MSRFLPPSKVTNSVITRSILGDGCVVRSGSVIEHSVIGLRALISEKCDVRDALIMGADYYETMEECALIPGCLPMGLGETTLACSKMEESFIYLKSHLNPLSWLPLHGYRGDHPGMS